MLYDDSKVLVRKETPADVQGIHALHVASFPGESEAKLVDALRAAGRLSASLVAVERNELIGHVAFSPVTIDGAVSAIGQGLAPVAVRADYRRRGIAERLVRDGLELCSRAGTGFVVVLGEPRYYARFGFQPARRFALRDEYDAGDAFQVLELVRGAIASEGGLVRYSPEFAALDTRSSAQELPDIER